MQYESIGVIGLGRMGAAIAARLHGVGCRVVGWNRSPRDLPEGVSAADDLAALVNQSTILITSLYDDAAVKAEARTASQASPSGSSGALTPVLWVALGAGGVGLVLIALAFSRLRRERR